MCKTTGIAVYRRDETCERSAIYGIGNGMCTFAIIYETVVIQIHLVSWNISEKRLAKVRAFALLGGEYFHATFTPEFVARNIRHYKPRITVPHNAYKPIAWTLIRSPNTPTHILKPTPRPLKPE